MMNKLRPTAIGLVVATVALGVLAGPASAHVTVYAPQATQGGEAVLTFRVPTESASANTIKVQVQLPLETPIATVLVQPTPGWTAKTSSSALPTPITNADGDRVTTAVSEIDWSANSAATAIKPGEFNQFVISAGPLPKVASLRFGVIQTYSDASVVKWIETAAPGSTVEPAHPAPVLTLAAGAAPTTTAPPPAHSSSSNTGPIVLSLIALVAAAGALGLGFVSRAQAKRS